MRQLVKLFVVTVEWEVRRNDHASLRNRSGFTGSGDGLHDPGARAGPGLIRTAADVRAPVGDGWRHDHPGARHGAAYDLAGRQDVHDDAAQRAEVLKRTAGQ